jgi:hypothetical protein
MSSRNSRAGGNSLGTSASFVLIVTYPVYSSADGVVSSVRAARKRRGGAFGRPAGFSVVGVRGLFGWRAGRTFAPARCWSVRPGHAIGCGTRGCGAGPAKTNPMPDQRITGNRWNDPRPAVVRLPDVSGTSAQRCGQHLSTNFRSDSRSLICASGISQAEDHARITSLAGEMDVFGPSKNLYGGKSGQNSLMVFLRLGASTVLSVFTRTHP